jgi:hypothetical protein
MAVPNLPVQPGAGAAPTGGTPTAEPAAPALPSVTITDNMDGTFTVMSADESMGSADAQMAEGTEESGMPVKGIDAALEQARSILAGEPSGEQLEQTFSSQFPGKKEPY